MRTKESQAGKVNFGRGVTMTCRKKLAMEQPDRVNDEFDGGCFGCPSDYGYLPNPDCLVVGCKRCWDREIPDTDEKIGRPLSKVTIVTRDANGKREVYKFDSQDAVDVTGKDESEEFLLILVGAICVYSKLAHTCITWEVVREFFA